MAYKKMNNKRIEMDCGNGSICESCNKAILDALPDEIAIINPKTRAIVAANKKLEKKYGGVCGRKCYEALFSKKSICSNCTIMKAITQNRQIKAIHSTMEKEKERHFSVITSPLNCKSSQSPLVMHIIRDITARVKAEKELKKLNHQLMMLYKTTTSLQLTMDINEIAKIAIQTFKAIGYDRVRFYLMKNGRLVGLKSSHLQTEEFKNIVLDISKSYPKAFEVVRKKKPVILKKFRSKYQHILDKYDVKESASIPLLSKDKVMGMISVDNKYSTKKIREQDLGLLMTFGNQIAVAIENAILYEENKKRIRKLSALYDISTALSGILDLSKVLNLVVIKIVKLFKVDSCAVFLPDEASNALIPKSAYHISGKHKLYSKKISLDDSISGKVFRTMSTIYKEDISSSERYEYREFVKRHKLKTMLCIPLGIENRPLGVVVLYSKKIRQFSSDDLELLKSMASQAALAINNTKLYERIKNDKESLGKLMQVSQEINSTLMQEEFLNKIIDKTLEFTSADYGFIMTLEKSSLKLRLSRGYDKKKARKISQKITEGVIAKVFRTGKPQIISNVLNESSYVPIDKKVRSQATIPLISKGKAIGVLNLESKNIDNFRRFSKSLEILTNQISTAIENVRLYNKITSFNQRLKQEIELATRELREKNKELKRIDKLKSDFVSNVSHELRTPLTSISGYTKLLYLEKLGQVNKKQKQSLSIILDESERLTRLINDVLDLSKLESGKINVKFEKVNIVKVCRNAIETLKNSADEKMLKIRLASPRSLFIEAGEDMIKQVFMNLLSNAIKFSPKKGEITIAIKGNIGDVEVSITDKGPGIPKKEIKKIFDKFYQVDSSMTRKHGGTGLGLVIVKHIINIHNGSINVISERGKGSTFIFRLPRKQKARKEKSS